MSDLRFDPLSGHWCLIAPHRSSRPVELQPVEKVNKGSVCPFCAGNESETPAALALYLEHASNSQPVTNGHAVNCASKWLSRVIPNKYASFGSVAETGNRLGSSSASSASGCQGSIDCGPYRTLSLPGPQELVIPTPRHVSSISALDEQENRVFWRAAQDRICEMKNAGVAKHAMLFMNCRSQAGASLEHIHFQLMGSPVVSDYLAGRVERNRQQLQSKNQTLIESILQWELEQAVRIVERTENFTVLCPFASRFAYQIWIVPHVAETSFIKLGESQRDELAELCRTMTARLETVLHHPPYNMLLQLAPFDDMTDDHWFVEFLPRTTRSAGFELGTDVWVNPVPPETAAQQLR